MKLRGVGLLVLFLVLWSATSQVRCYADDYPDRDIHAISPAPPGGGIDIFIRYFASKLQTLANKTVVVENKVGAFGLLGTEYVARAKPDGYTVAITPASAMMASAVHTFKSVPYDPVSDFEPVTTLAKLPFVLVVDTRRPWNSVSDLTAYLAGRKEPGFYASVTNTHIVSAELYKQAAKVDAQNVMYKDSASILNDMLAGHIDFCFADPVFATAQVKSGKLRALAVTSSFRIPPLPDVPTMAESGMNYPEVISWWGVFTPKNTPKAINGKLEEWFNTIARSEETRDFLAKVGAVPFPGDASFLRTYLAKEISNWGEYAKIAKIEKQ